MDLISYITKKLLTITHYDNFSWNDLALFIAIPCCCLIIEAFIVGWKNSSLYLLTHQYKLVSNDFFCFLIHAAGLYQLIGMLFYGGLFYFLYGQIQKKFGFHLINTIDSHALQFGIMIFVGDFKNYWRHWFQHKLGWAWELHKMHHSAEQMTMLTYFRSHAAESVLTNFLDLFPFIIFGAPAETFAMVYIAREAHQYFLYSQINHNWGIVGKYILVSPAAHRLHHSNNPLHYGKNLGNTFIIWDRLFGTYFAPATYETYEFGIPDNHFNKKGFFYDLFHSYLDALGSLKNSILYLFKSQTH